MPLPLLDPDEANIVPRAWDVVHDAALDPGWYDYPSLLVYLVAPFQALADAPSYGAARVLAVVLGRRRRGRVVAGSARLRPERGRSRCVRGRGLDAPRGVLAHCRHRRPADTRVTVRARPARSTGRLEWAASPRARRIGEVPGHARSAVPVVVAAWGEWGRLARAALVRPVAFRRDQPVRRHPRGRGVGRHRARVAAAAREGWLGFEDDPATAARVLSTGSGTGSGRSCSSASLGLGLARRARRSRADLVLASFVAVWFVHLLPLDAHFDRYVLPLVPVLGRSAATRPAARARSALVLLLVPLAWSIGDARDADARTDTRLDGRRRGSRRTSPDTDPIAAEPSTSPLAGRPVRRLELPGPGQRSSTRIGMSTG